MATGKPIPMTRPKKSKRNPEKDIAKESQARNREKERLKIACTGEDDDNSRNGKVIMIIEAFRNGKPKEPGNPRSQFYVCTLSYSAINQVFSNIHSAYF